MHFKINFEHIETDAGGTILINENDLAYTNIYLESIDSAYTGSFFRGFSSANVNYRKLDGKYYLNYYDINIHYINILTGEHFVFNAVYAVTNAKLDDASPIPYNKTVKYTDIFMDSPVDTSAIFWNDYNIIEDDQHIKYFTKRYEPQPPKEGRDIHGKLSRFIEGFSFQTTFGTIWWNKHLYPGELVAFENTNTEIERARYVYDDKPLYLMSFSVGYNLSRQSSVNYYLTSNIFSKDNYISHDFSYLYRTRIKHYGNPLFLDAGGGFSFFKHENHPVFEKRSQSYPFIFRSQDIRYVGIKGRSINLKAQLTYFPERFLAVVLNAGLGYITDSESFFSHNDDRLPGYNITYQILQTYEPVFFKDRLRPAVLIGLKFYPFGAY